MLYSPADILAGPHILKTCSSADSYHIFAQSGQPVERTFDLHYFGAEKDLQGNLRLADTKGIKVPYERPVELSRIRLAAETYNLSSDYRDYIASEVPIVTADVPNRNCDCLVGSSLVPTDVGLVPLRDIPQSVAKYVLTPDGPCKIHNWRRVGYMPTVKVTLRDGRTLQGTADHEVLMVDHATLAAVWRPLGELSPSDCVVCQTGNNFEVSAKLPPTPQAEKFLALALEARDDQRYSRCINEITTPSTMTAELARLLGYLVSEGTVTHPNTVAFSNNDPKLLDDFCHCWQATFGLEIKPTYRESDSGGYACGSSVLARQWLASIGLGYQRAVKKRVPWAVLQSSTRLQAEFLRAYIAGDGCVSHDTVIMASASSKLLRQIQCMLLGTGAHTTFSLGTSAGKRTIGGRKYNCRAVWRLVANRTAAEKLLEQLGILPGAKGDLTVAGAVRADRNDAIPFARVALEQLVNERRAGRDGGGPYKYRDDNGKLVTAYLSPGALGKTLHKDEVKPLLSDINKIDAELGHSLSFLCRDDVFVGEVVAVERAGEEWVYDIGVEQAHRFVANGVVVHNCFSYQELSFYNPLYGVCSFETFRGKGVHLQHDNQDPKKAKGLILDASLRKVGYAWHVMILLAVDRTKDRQLVEEIVRSPVVGWCLTKGTLISTSKGLVPIESLGHGRKLRQSLPVEGVTVDTPNGSGRVTHWFYSGLKPVIELQTRLGLSVRGSTNQMALILQPDLTTEWVEFKDVKPGMYVAMASEPTHAWPEKLPLPVVEVKDDTTEYREPIRCRICRTDCMSLSSHIRFSHLTSVDDYRRRFHYDGPMAAFTNRNPRPKSVTLPTTLTTELATVLGFLAAEGGVYRINGYRMTSLSNTDESIVSEYSDAFEQCFGSAPTANWTARGAGDRINGVKVKSRKPTANVYFHSETVAEFLTQIAGKCVTHDSHHKEVPWSILQAPQASAAAFLRALYLGDGSGRFRRDSLYRSITLYSASPIMRQQVQLMLLRFGIRSHLTDHDDRYPEVVVSDTRSMVRFMREIMGDVGFDLDYEERVGKLPYLSHNDKGVTVSWLVSGAGKEWIRSLDDRKQRNLRRLLALRCEWVEITAADECGEEETFDLTVEGTEGPLSDPSCFPANGIYCHNSMGALVSYTVCSICGFRSNGKVFCEPHIGRRGEKKGRIFDGRISFEDCLTGDTLVASDHGLVPLRKLKSGISRYQLPTSYGNTRMLGWQRKGLKEVRQVTTSAGFQLEGTNKHLIRVVNPDLTLGFKPLGELTETDWVVLRKGGAPDRRRVDLTPARSKVTAGSSGRNYTNPHTGDISRAERLRLPDHMTPTLAAILGYLGAEGTIYSERCWFSNIAGEYIKEYTHNCKQVFNLTPHHYSGISYALNRTALMQFLNAIGLKPVRSRHKRVPWSILRANRRCQLAYLRAYINGDGCIMPQHRELNIVSSSDGMIRDLQVMLLSLGYVGRIKRSDVEISDQRPRAITLWYVTVYGRSAEELAGELGYVATDHWQQQIKRDIYPRLDIVPYAAQLMMSLRQERCAVSGAKGYYTCDDGASQRLSFSLKTTGGNNYGYQLKGEWHKDNLRSVMPAISALDPTAAANLQVLLSDNLFFDRVVTNISTGLKEVYDVMVAENGHDPEFTANGFVVHNCRLVNFIETSKVKNPADINAYSKEKLMLADAA